MIVVEADTLVRVEEGGEGGREGKRKGQADERMEERTGGNGRRRGGGLTCRKVSFRPSLSNLTASSSGPETPFSVI